MRISASSYSNTAPLIWSFLYGSRKGSVEVILDNAPARSAQLLENKRVDAALVPVIAYQSIPGLFIVPDVCVGAEDEVKSVCLVTGGIALEDVKSIALDTSSRTSVAMTKILFREFYEEEPKWIDHSPDVNEMLASADCALLIGDPALSIETDSEVSKFDLVELWKNHTGFGFVFAMWMATRKSIGIDFAAARDEGLGHLVEIVGNYRDDIDIDAVEMSRYLSETISFEINDSMKNGLALFFQLAEKHGLIDSNRPLKFTD